MGHSKTSVRPPCTNYLERSSDEKLQHIYANPTCTDGIDVLVHGPPGVGKTELVYKFLHDNKLQSLNVIWIHASRHQFIVESFETINNKKITSKDILSQVMAQVYAEFSNIPGKTVLVFDEATSHTELEKLLPATQIINQFFIIVTSINSDIHTKTKIHLDVFTNSEVKNYVKQSINDEELVNMICINMKHTHGNVPAILSSLIVALNTSKIHKDDLKLLSTDDNNHNNTNMLQQLLLVSIDTGYNKLLDNMLEQPLRVLETLDQNAIEAFKILAYLKNVHQNLFQQPNLKQGIFVLQNTSLAMLEEEIVVTNPHLAFLCRTRFAADAEQIVEKCMDMILGCTQNNKFTVPSLADVAIQAWSDLCQFQSQICKYVLIALALITNDNISIQEKRNLATKSKDCLMQCLQENKDNDNLHELMLQLALICYHNEDYKIAEEYNNALGNLTFSSAAIIRARGELICCQAKLNQNQNYATQFSDYIQNTSNTKYSPQVDTVTAAFFIFDNNENFHLYVDCWRVILKDQKVIINNIEPFSFNYYYSLFNLFTQYFYLLQHNDDFSRHLLKITENLYEKHRLQHIVDLCSVIETDSLPFSQSEVTLLDYKARSHFLMAKQEQLKHIASLEKAFSTLQILHNRNNEQPLCLYNSFEDLCDSARTLDASPHAKTSGNFDWIFSQFAQVIKCFIYNIFLSCFHFHDTNKIFLIIFRKF